MAEPTEPSCRTALNVVCGPHAAQICSTEAELERRRQLQEFTYVGPKGGGYEKVSTYRYVGQGQGDFDFGSSAAPGAASADVAHVRLLIVKWAFLCMAAVAVFLVAGASSASLLPLPGAEVAGGVAGEAKASSAPKEAGGDAGPIFELAVNASAGGLDCEAGYADWRRAWTAEKMRYCCRTIQRGCEATETRLYACTASDAKAWGFWQRRWCCSHDDVGCPEAGEAAGSGSGVQTAAVAEVVVAQDMNTSGTAVTAAAGDCNSPCAIAALGAEAFAPKLACRAAIQHLADREFRGAPNACAAGHEQVRGLCPACAGCSLASAGCQQVEALATAATTTVAWTSSPSSAAPSSTSTALQPQASPEVGGRCRSPCTLDNRTASCRAHVQALAAGSYGGVVNGCLLAVRRVHENCADCLVCSPLAAGCAEWAPASRAYDCDSGISDFARIWSEAKKAWCCKWEHRGCAPAVSYDCESGYATWQEDWSLFRKAWCCQHRNKACPKDVKEVDDFDCNSGYAHWERGWSSLKKSWCCQHAGMGCSSTMVH